MTRKSTAKTKPIKVVNSSKFLKQQEPPSIEETFDNIKQVIVNTAEVAVVQAGRVSNLANLREAAYRFWGSELDAKLTDFKRMDYFKQLLEVTIACYENILDIVRSFEMDEFLKEDMKDYFADITPKVADVETEENLFEATLIMDIIKPWGEKMTQLHHQMLEECNARRTIEEN